MVYFLFLKAGPASSGFGLHFIVDCVVNETPSKRNVSCMTHNLVRLTTCAVAWLYDLNQSSTSTNTEQLLVSLSASPWRTFENILYGVSIWDSSGLLVLGL